MPGWSFNRCSVEPHKLLTNEMYSDVSFLIDEKNALHAHYVILKRSIFCFLIPSVVRIVSATGRFARLSRRLSPSSLPLPTFSAHLSVSLATFPLCGIKQPLLPSPPDVPHAQLPTDRNTDV